MAQKFKRSYILCQNGERCNMPDNCESCDSWEPRFDAEAVELQGNYAPDGYYAILLTCKFGRLILHAPSAQYSHAFKTEGLCHEAEIVFKEIARRINNG